VDYNRVFFCISRCSVVSDWAHITAQKMSVNSGDDVAGIVHAMGSEVAATEEFRIGDRVAGFHKMLEQEAFMPNMR
jgi:hypothetical protein